MFIKMGELELSDFWVLFKFNVLLFCGGINFVVLFEGEIRVLLLDEVFFFLMWGVLVFLRFNKRLMFDFFVDVEVVFFIDCDRLLVDVVILGLVVVNFVFLGFLDILLVVKWFLFVDGCCLFVILLKSWVVSCCLWMFFWLVIEGLVLI